MGKNRGKDLGGTVEKKRLGQIPTISSRNPTFCVWGKIRRRRQKILGGGEKVHKKKRSTR